MDRQPFESADGARHGEPHNAWRLIAGATGYRPLSEAEWEYACRAGTQTEFSIGNDETLLTSYCQMRPAKRTSLCGEKMPNGWGLHDMHGNVYELCENLYDVTFVNRICRGGSWDDGTESCRAAHRVPQQPSARTMAIGFRLALSPSVHTPLEVQDR